MKFILIYVLAMALKMCSTDDIFAEISLSNYHTKIGIPRATLLLASEAISHDKLIIINEIIGGQITHIQDVPYQAGLVITLSTLTTSVCGGSLISNTRVLTAGHCYDDGVLVAISFTIVLGSNKIFTDGQRVVTDDVTAHPMWNPKTIENDIAILRMPAIEFSDSIQPIALPSEEMLSNKFAGWTSLASGFGITGDDLKITSAQHLSTVHLKIISNKECSLVFGNHIKESHICTLGNDTRSTCHGDSGGPLAVKIHGKSVLVGTTSFGSSTGCEKGFPAVYTRTTSFVNWIINE